MDSPRQMWLKRRGKISLGFFVQILLVKILFAFGLGAYLASFLKPWVGWLIALGVGLDLLFKWRWLGGIPKGSLNQIWLANRERLSYGGVCGMVGGKQLVMLGIGALLSPYLGSWAWVALLVWLLLGVRLSIQFFKL